MLKAAATKADTAAPTPAAAVPAATVAADVSLSDTCSASSSKERKRSGAEAAAAAGAGQWISNQATRQPGIPVAQLGQTTARQQVALDQAIRVLGCPVGSSKALRP